MLWQGRRIEGIGCEEGLVKEGGCWDAVSWTDIGTAEGAGMPTFHDTRLVNCELDAYVADLDVCFVGEGDATEEQEQLSGGAGHGREYGEILVVHDLMV